MKKILIVLFAVLCAWIPSSGQHTVSGHLWNENSNTPVWYIKTVYAHLVDYSSGLVIASTPVAGGAWGFTNVPNGDYLVRVSATQATIGQLPPAALLIGLDCDRYQFTYNETNDASGNTHPFQVLNANVSNLMIRVLYQPDDCGMDGAPVAFDVVKNVMGAPVMGFPVNLGDLPLNGVDRVLTGGVTQSWAGHNIVITQLPSDGFILKYDGEPIVLNINSAIDEYMPSLLTIEPGPTTPGGSDSTTFYYVIKDNSNLTSAVWASYTVNFSAALPLVFGSITATKVDNNLVVNFTTEREENVDHFEIEASADGTNFTTIGTVSPGNLNGNSEENLRYEFSLNADQAAGLLGASIFGIAVLSLVKIGRRKKLLLSALLSIGVAIAIPSCSKNDASINKDSQLYIRIVQHAKDGTVQYSKVVKAISE